MNPILIGAVLLVLVTFVQASQSKCPSTKTLPSDGCIAEYFYIDLTGIDPKLGQICATNTCLLGGSCPSSAKKGTALSSNPKVNQIIGALAAKIATPNLKDVCYVNAVSCNKGFTPIDLRKIEQKLGVVCAGSSSSACDACSSKCESGSSNDLGSNKEKVLGALGQYLQCTDINQLCWYKLNTED